MFLFSPVYIHEKRHFYVHILKGFQRAVTTQRKAFTVSLKHQQHFHLE